MADLYLKEGEILALIESHPGFRTGLTAATGGTAVCLDAVVTAGRDVGLVVPVINAASGAWDWYHLRVGTDAELAPWVVRPDDYAGGTNEKVWELCNLMAPTIDLGNPDSGDALVIQLGGASGAEHLVTEPDDDPS